MHVLGIFLDTETNGLNARKHRILEIAFKILHLQTGQLIAEFQSLIAISLTEWETSDPESLLVNGFTWQEVSQGKTSPLVAAEIRSCFHHHGIKRGEAFFICQNPSFDRAFFSQLIDPETQEALLWPYHWLDLASMYWAEAIRKGKQSEARYPWETGVSKDKIAQAHHLPKEATPHRAMNGVNHLILCYTAVVGFPLTHLTQHAWHCD